MSLLREPPWVRFTSILWPGSFAVADPSNTNLNEITLANSTNAQSHVGGSPIASGGGVLFVENGALKYHGANGTITTLADA